MEITGLPISFVKMSGTGNDFIIIDHREPVIPTEHMQEFARRVCRRNFSVGADGLFLLENSDTVDFKWQFFNSDGSVAEMCGNGARCVARFAYMHDIAGAKMKFETIAGIIEATVHDTSVAVKMIDPHSFQLDSQIEIEGQTYPLHSVDTGVPHAVIFFDNVDTVDVARLGRMIRNHQMFFPAGTNVNFVDQRDSGLKVRTYERGVEEETMACGTGAVAAALIAGLKKTVETPVEVITSGGDILTIDFTLTGEQQAENVFLQGPTRVIYTGELTVEALLG